MDDELVIDVKVDTGKVAQQLADATNQVRILKQEQKNLTKAFEEGTIADEAYAKAMAESKAELEKANREVKSSTALLQLETTARLNDNMSLDEQRQTLNAVQKAYAGMTKEQKDAAGGAEYLEKQIKALSDKVKENESAIGDNRRNVGNYAESIQQAASNMGALGNGVTNVTGTMQKAKSVMTVIAAHPLIAVLGVLITLLMKIAERFKSNAAAMEQLNDVFGAFSGVANIANRIIDKIAHGLGWIAEKALDLAYKLRILKKDMQEGVAIAREDMAIQKAQRDAALKNAEDQKKIAELKAAVAEKDKRTAKERIALLQQANTLEENIAQRSYDLAKREYELQVKKNAQSASSQEDLKKENDLKIAMINAETALFQKRKELNGQLAAARAEMSAQEKAQAEQARKNAEANTKLVEEEAEKLAALREEIRRRSQTDLQNQIEDLEKARDAELAVVGLSAEEKIAIEKYYDAEVKKLRTVALKDQGDLESEAAQFIKGLREETLDEQYKEEMDQLQAYYDAGLVATEEYERAKAEIEEQYRVEKAQKDAEQVQNFLDAAKGLNDAINGIEDAALARYEQGQNERKKALEKRLKAGQISQEQYAAETEKIDEETERKKIEIEREQAIREKAFGIMQATIDTAMAIIRALADPGGFAGIALSALAGTTGAAQIAAIAAQPLPQFATGGIVGGNSYAGDQMLVRANSGEMFINSDSQRRLFDALSNDKGEIGINYEALAAANAAQPAPVMVYKEFEEFGDKVATYKEIAAI